MKERFRRRRLPHWDKPGAIYFVTACLTDCIPAGGLADLDRFRAELDQRSEPDSIPLEEWNVRKWKQVFARFDEWLDQRPAARHLANERLATEVVKSLFHFAAERYALWAYVVMPSHFHWVFEPLAAWVESLGASADDRSPRERIMHSVKRHSARTCNVLLNTHGAFWQDESYDHCVQNVDELRRIIDYVELNPVRAGLCPSSETWVFSSAYYRLGHGLEGGRPIVGDTAL